MNTKTSTLFFVGLGLAGCIEKAKIDLPEVTPKIVLTCFISPGDSVINAVVRMSNPKYATGQSTGVFSDDIRDARVFITDGSSNLQLPFRADLSYYSAGTSGFPVVSGRSYTISALTPDGKNVTASTTVPTGTLQFSGLVLNKRTDQAGTLEFDLNITVDDLPDQTNYIAMGVSSLFAIKTSSTGAGDSLLQSANPLAFFADDERSARSSYFYTHSAGVGLSRDSIRSAEVVVEAFNCSREFYRYHETASRAGGAGENPFADPVSVYTNVKNGFGCFGAYVQSYRYLKVR